jgi:hypothetical protein
VTISYLAIGNLAIRNNIKQTQSQHTTMASTTTTKQPSHIATGSSTATDLAQELTSQTSPTTPHSATDAQRGMSHVDAWKPQFNRRQSWNKEEHKHALQMSRVGDVKTGPGFSERS